MKEDTTKWDGRQGFLLSLMKIFLNIHNWKEMNMGIYMVKDPKLSPILGAKIIKGYASIGTKGKRLFSPLI